MRNNAVEAGARIGESLELLNERRIFSVPKALRKKVFYFSIYSALCFFLIESFNVHAQQTYTSQFSPQMSGQFAPGQPGSSSGNYLKNSAAFRQEIMKMEINVTREGQTLPITQVPRVQRGDIIRMHLLEESTGGIKPHESMWNWTFLVAFINPNRKSTARIESKESGGQDKDAAGGTVSEEIQFRKTGWYKEYAFKVPFDSQPVFFLYPRPKYRSQILKLVGKKYEEVRQLGEKTIELANAYSRINSFLGELQSVLYRTQSSYYGSFVTYPKPPNGTNNNGSYNPYNPYNPYGTGSGTYNPYPSTGTYNPYNPYGSTTGNANNPNQRPLDPVFNYNAFFEQTIERLAASFNLTLPNCWQSFNGGYNYFGTPGGYGSSYGGGFNSGYSGGYSSGSYGGLYGGTSGGGGNGVNSFGHAVSSEFIGRAQCVAKGIRLEDFDFSVGRMLQQGGLFALTQLRDKYPHLAYYINIAAIAIEFIVRVFQKYPMKIMPTLIQTSDGNSFGATTNNGTNGGSNNGSYNSGNPYGGNSSGYNGGSYSATASNSYGSPNSSFTPAGNNFPNSATSGNSGNSVNFTPVKISVYAETQPTDADTVSAYPIIVHRWQSEPDPEVISLNPPVPSEPCLHAGINILKSTDISKDDSQDTFTRDFKLTVSSENGFTKTFPLKKNLGAGGWELNLTNEDLNSFPKVNMTLEAEVTGTRGFSEVKSPKFALPLNTGNNWQIKPEAAKAFAVGGKRLLTLQNNAGTCRCLQAVIYKPSFGGQFVFEVNAKNPNSQLQFSLDGREVSFEIDATNFQPGQGTLEIKTYDDNQPSAGNPSPTGMNAYGQTATQPNGQNNQFNQSSQNNPNGSYGQNNQNNQSGQSNILGIKLYPLPPNVTGVKMARGDNQATITGERLEQIQYVKINGKRALIVGNLPQARTGSASNMVNGGQTSNNQTSGGMMGGGSMGNNSAASNPAGGMMSSVPSVMPTINPNQMVSANPSAIVSAFSPIGAGERLAIFEDPNAVLTDNVIALELGLEDDRSFPFPNTFAPGPSRPAIASVNHEIEGVAVGSNGQSNNQQPVSSGAINQIAKRKQTPSSQFSTLSSKDVFSVETREIAVDVQNTRTDYDFKPENLTIETRIENGGANTGEMPRTSFEVFDWKSMRLKIVLNEQIAKIIGGRRLQFRLRDKERGDSDWYTVRQTFVRIPKIRSVKCTKEMNGQCELRGTGIDYIGQVSVDGENTWFPGENQILQTQTAADGTTTAMIPHYANKKMLKIRLRDYPQTAGIEAGDCSFVNTVKSAVKSRDGKSNSTKTANPNSKINQSQNTVTNNAQSVLPVSPSKVSPIIKSSKSRVKNSKNNNKKKY